MSITEKRLDEIQDRVDAATKGPWNHDVIEFRNHMSNAVKAPQTDELGTELVMVAHTGYGFGSPHRNASFMAHAREDVPALLAEVERLRDELAKAREVTDEKVERVQSEIYRQLSGAYGDFCVPSAGQAASVAAAALGGGDDEC